eukprot:TRINITY_DN37019_c0_g1_i1.p1 TRINITY_DN37019_c0_g1~~TRINITY_DN37019_c0_g1_i1.p1  ORF type:complete len:195 (-),score=29.94 TRINITY_DN37019_c0_g1_i1:104-688(-)
MPCAARIVFLIFVVACAGQLKGSGRKPKQATLDMFRAAREGDVQGILWAMSQHGDPNWKNEEGLTAMHAAVLEGHLESIQYLLAAGADKSIPNPDGLPALHLAAHRGNARLVDGMLKHGFTTMERDANGLFPLHNACQGGDAAHTEVVEALLAHGASADQRTEDGRTCLDITQNPLTIHLVSQRGAVGARQEEL